MGDGESVLVGRHLGRLGRPVSGVIARHAAFSSRCETGGGWWDQRVNRNRHGLGCLPRSYGNSCNGLHLRSGVTAVPLPLPCSLCFLTASLITAARLDGTFVATSSMLSAMANSDTGGVPRSIRMAKPVVLDMPM